MQAHGNDILLDLLIIFAAAQVGSWLARSVKLPGVVGEIAAGCLVGPSLLGWIAPSEPLEVLSEIGVVLLLFAVGLETRIEDMKRVGRSAFLVGLLGVVVPFIFGSLWAHGAGFDWAKSLFVAAAFVATSAGITARVLQELGVLQRQESRVILGAAVIDDILAMLLLGIVTAMQSGENVQVGKLAIVLSEAIGFVVLIGLLGTKLVRRSTQSLAVRQWNLLPPALALCLGLAFLSTRFGLAAIIGAFLAGMVASEAPQRERLEHDVQPLLTLLTPFFFVLTGAKIELAQLASVDAMLTLALITAIALASKLIGGGLGALALGKRGALIVGVGMMPRGEVGVVIASLGLAAGVFSPRIYALIVAMSLLTSVVTPPLLAWLFKREPARH
ncbi:MAG: cation:proton antiporter [Proteobacteria bacterium]|nr:cation:proton antiporter [Pseudomonadota bacterium]